MAVALVDYYNFKISEKNESYSLSILPGCYCIFNLEMPNNGMHSHDKYELCIVDEGEGKYCHNNSIIDIKKGDIFIAEPYARHEISVLDSGYLKLMYFSVDFEVHNENEETKILSDFLKSHVITKQNQKQILLYMSFINQYYILSQKSDFGVKQAMKNLVLESLKALTVTNNQEKPDIQSYELSAAVNYIEENISKKLMIEDIAKHSGVSVRKLQYMFKNYYDLTVISYITKRKMFLAASYLRMNFNVCEVARLVGIDDPSQFSRTFKKQYGVSPKHYKL